MRFIEFGYASDSVAKNPLMKKILVLCTGNSCRSQIAEAYLRKFSSGSAEIYSAGIEAHGLNPRAIAIMNEDQIDITKHTSNLLTEFADLNFDIVITVCDNANELCPVYPANTKKIHHSFPDPAKATGTEQQIMQQFRSVRNEIRQFCLNFFEEHNLSRKY